MPRPTNAPQPVRLALAPGFLGAIVLMAGLALVGTKPYHTWIDYPAAILAAITAYFAIQAKLWWLVVVLAVMVVVWNPVYPLPLPDLAFSGLSILGAASFIAAGVLIKVTPNA